MEEVHDISKLLTADSLKLKIKVAKPKAKKKQASKHHVFSESGRFLDMNIVIR